MAIIVGRKLVLEKVVLEEKEALYQEAIDNLGWLERLKKVLEEKEALHQEAIENLGRSKKVLEREKALRQEAADILEKKEALHGQYRRCQSCCPDRWRDSNLAATYSVCIS
jgi:hypothetical protein